MHALAEMELLQIPEEADLFRIILVKCDAEVGLDFIAHDNMSKLRLAFAVVVERREVGLFECPTGAEKP